MPPFLVGGKESLGQGRTVKEGAGRFSSPLLIHTFLSYTVHFNSKVLHHLLCKGRGQTHETDKAASVIFSLISTTLICYERWKCKLDALQMCWGTMAMITEVDRSCNPTLLIPAWYLELR